MSQENLRNDEAARSIQQTEPNAAGLVQITTWIREDQACALEMLLLAEQQHRRAPCDPAELFQEALDLLIAARFRAVRLPSGKDKQRQPNDKPLLNS